MIYITYWLIYSFLGWIVETVYTSTLKLSFQDRGFLTLPFIPIYGFGAMISVVFLQEFSNNIILLFILSVILTSLLEYITSFLMDKIFHMKWWDYSNRFLNINGRVCFINSMMFGMLSVVLLHFIHPAVHNFLVQIPTDVIYQITKVMLIVVFFDSLHSILFGLTFSAVFNEIERAEILPSKEYLELKDKIHNLEHRLLIKYPELKEDLIDRHQRRKKPRD